MLQKDVFPQRTKWAIIVIGMIAGLLWALPDGFNLHHRYSLYLPPLSLTMASILAFTLYHLRDLKPWLCALLTLPVTALMTGWYRWNFPTLSLGEFHFKNICAVIFMLSLVMPMLAALCNKSQQQGGTAWSRAVTEALWRNTFTLAVTSVITGLFWLVLMLWSNLFSIIGITLFEQIFFDNRFFPPIATGAVIAAGIVLCRRLPGAAGLYRQLMTRAVNVLLPLHAVALLLFLACLPFTGLAIIPKAFSATTLLLTMTLLMLAFSAIAGESASDLSRGQRTIARVVLVAQALTPLLAGLAVWALWLRVAEYGWTVERIYAAMIALLAVTGSLLLLWSQRRGWSQGAGSITAFIPQMLTLTASCWFLLHTPIADPWRIVVKNQLARFEQGKATVDIMDLYLFSDAGRRGKQALQKVSGHPQWLREPVRQKALLMQLLAERDASNANPTISDLQRSIPLRAGSEAPPQSWWQSLARNVAPSISVCLVDSDSCLVWMQDLNNDGSPEVLLYSRNQPEIVIYARQGIDWQQIGNVTLPENMDKTLREAMPKTAIKPWRDLDINGQRYPVQYYNHEGQ
ncbi:DUF4153 domain-containing protein [Pantoea brenneri]|uniref:DUF4153 domain-containing protein n=1 Tax=Pantoea brenneri TaxID=472694 RepID=UPI002896DF1F|nr:DUF4153 domain-containing protein [Pantoea brenneri]